MMMMVWSVIVRGVIAGVWIVIMMFMLLLNWRLSPLEKLAKDKGSSLGVDELGRWLLPQTLQ